MPVRLPRPTLLQRLGLTAFHARDEREGERVLLARITALLALAGSTISLVAWLVSGDGGWSATATPASIACGYAIGAIALGLFERLPLWIFASFGLAGVTLVSVPLAMASTPMQVYVLFYVWIALASAYFLSRRLLALELAAIGLAYAGALASGDHHGPAIVAWLVTVGTITVAAALVVGLKERLVRLREQERHELEQLRELERLREELRQSQKLEAIGTLAGGVAHDFNNLLTGIIGYADLAETRASRDPGLAEEIHEIRTAAERAAALTRQLLAFSRRQLLSPQVLDLNDLVDSTARMLRRMLDERVALELTLAPEPLPVLADPVQLQQVVLNLAVNARDAMPAGGRLGIETGRRNGDVWLAVRDTGDGMSEETRARAFEPYFTTKASGTGLGLSSVYGIVTQSGGWVEIESGPGRGTLVSVTLARAEAPVGAATGGEEKAPAAEPGTVLLVEDEQVVRAVTRRILDRSGYRVLEASDGREALGVAETAGPIDVVLTDVVMPEMTGPELAQAIAPSRPEAAVVFMSGYPGDAIDRGALEERAVFLAKPFTPEVLLETVAGVLASRATR
ncbi:MAG: response regulator [Gaiellales bacterium]